MLELASAVYFHDVAILSWLLGGVNYVFFKNEKWFLVLVKGMSKCLIVSLRLARWDDVQFQATKQVEGWMWCVVSDGIGLWERPLFYVDVDYKLELQLARLVHTSPKTLTMEHY